MDTRVTNFVHAAANVVALLAGGEPLRIWADWKTYEDDMCSIVDAMGVVADIAKPSLEERARKARAGRPVET